MDMPCINIATQYGPHNTLTNNTHSKTVDSFNLKSSIIFEFSEYEIYMGKCWGTVHNLSIFMRIATKPAMEAC